MPPNNHQNLYYLTFFKILKSYTKKKQTKHFFHYTDSPTSIRIKIEAY